VHLLIRQARKMRGTPGRKQGQRGGNAQEVKRVQLNRLPHP